MNKVYEADPNKVIDLENFYQEFILPEFGIAFPVVWIRHVKTGPDSFLHLFKVNEIEYALAFDDYPGGFSVEKKSYVKSVKLADGQEIIHISMPNDKYEENVTGAFMVFQITDSISFKESVEYLEASFEKVQREWKNNSKQSILIARDLLQLAETASQNKDSTALYSLGNILEILMSLDAEDMDVPLGLLSTYVKILIDKEFDYEMFSDDEKDQVADEVYELLSKDVRDTMTIKKYETEYLGETVRLVSAMYVRIKNGKTEGITATVLFENETIEYPSNHFINEELKTYFVNNPFIAKNNIEQHMPELLRDYRLVEGTVHVQDIFLRELKYISY